MAIEALSETLQNLILVNFEFFLKKLIIAIPLVWSIYYVFYGRKHQKETPFFMLAYIRTVLYLLAVLYLWISPVTLLLLYPQVQIDLLIRMLFSFYMIGFFVFGIVLFVNIIFIGPKLVLRVGGIDFDKTRTDKLMIALFGKKNAAKIIKSLPEYKNRFLKNG